MKANRSTKSSRAKVVRNVILCLSPLLSFAFVEPEWVARLVAITGCAGMINLLILTHGLNPRTGFAIAPPPADGKETEKEKRDRRAPRVIKVLAILFGVLMFWFLTIPTIRDCIGVIHKGRSYLIEVEGKVLDNQGVFGTRTITQGFIIVEKGNTSGNPYSAVLFRRIAREGKTYRFLIAPESKIVLDWN
jgi:hypothetical protein